MSGPSDAKKWTLRKLIVMIAAGVLAVGVTIGAVVLAGVGTWGKPALAHPPCEDLPSVTEVEDALDTHEEFIQSLEAIDESVNVLVERPCEADQHRGVVVVEYSSDEDKETVDNLFEEYSGLGVPATVRAAE